MYLYIIMKPNITKYRLELDSIDKYLHKLNKDMINLQEIYNRLKDYEFDTEFTHSIDDILAAINIRPNEHNLILN